MTQTEALQPTPSTIPSYLSAPSAAPRYPFAPSTPGHPLALDCGMDYRLQ